VRWTIAHKADLEARELADRHYSRRTVGAAQFVPPGRSVVLKAPRAFWVTSWPLAEFTKHAWPTAWTCSSFRNEGEGLSSELIREAVAATRAEFGEPPSVGMITFVDPSKVKRKRDPGRCFVRAGFRWVACTLGGHGRHWLAVLQLLPADMPALQIAKGSQLDLFAKGSA
jgi:hypothetical protein